MQTNDATPVETTKGPTPETDDRAKKRLQRDVRPPDGGGGPKKDGSPRHSQGSVPKVP